MKSFKIITILSLLIVSTIVNAHSGLINSVPENGSMLNKLPENVTLTFSMPVKLVKLQLIEASKEPIKLIAKPSKKFGLIFTITLPMLDSGNYKVKWVVMGKDAHKMKGDFTFTLAPSGNEKLSTDVDVNNN
jgi:methionine-rich copper-binding protein CopC